MNADEYLARLQAQLKGLPTETQTELIEEIAAHLEEGKSDEQLSTDPHQRADSLMNEMGTPEEMGRRMQRIHHHNRWLDYLLVVAPPLIITRLIDFVLVSFFVPHTAAGAAIASIFIDWSIRVDFLLYLVLMIIGLQRYRRFGTPGLAVYWLVETFWIVCAIILREQRWNLQGSINQTPAGLVETIFWLGMLIGSGIILYRTVTRAKEALIVVLAMLPFFEAAGNLITSQMLISGSLPNGYHLPQWIVFYFGPTQISLVIWPALFFLFRQRTIRWVGLLAYAVPVAIMNLVASASYPGLVLVWSLPLLLVLAGWMMDVYIRQHRKPVVE